MDTGERWCVVGTGEGDGEGGLIGGALIVSNGVVDGDVERLTFFKVLVSGVSWIEGPSAGL